MIYIYLFFMLQFIYSTYKYQIEIRKILTLKGFSVSRIPLLLNDILPFYKLIKEQHEKIEINKYTKLLKKYIIRLIISILLIILTHYISCIDDISILKKIIKL